MKYRYLLVACALTACIRSQTKTPKEKFSEHVRSTEFRTPEEERAGFKLPPGFEITLFAAEPDISKPINMEFDDRGRLWVTQSSEYPMAANPGKGKDRITILEDKDGDGRADSFTHFEDSLNIPIGIMPVAGGAIAYSIPDVYRYTDSNDDGKADQQQVLYGPFGFRDTHGMVNNFTRGFDGWIYACHGFTNTSTIAGTDGDSITMVSGNTFRFRADGSRVERTSNGRVNPFGNAWDEWGYLYSADCHSKPIYQLIKGGEYPHFGKRSPGIGFAPEMMHYELGSTAIAGLDYYIGEQFPEEYRHSFYSGDVVTCQINRNSMTLKGTTPTTKREPDFLISDDPWFRPVDIKTGPDGALYVADFYNRIIGHYEVSLTHPGRDRVSGRIWKIIYTGNKAAKVTDWTKASMPELLAGLRHPQLNIRMKIADRLVDVWKDKAVGPVTEMMPSAKGYAYIQGLWILFRLHALPPSMLDSALHHSDAMIRVHALRVLREMDTLSEQHRSIAIAALKDNNPHVRRIATETLGRFAAVDNIAPLLTLYEGTGEADSHLRYTLLAGIRDNLQNDNVMRVVAHSKWTDAQLAVLTKTMLDVPSPSAASYVLNYLQTHTVPQEQLVKSMEYIGRYVPPAHLDAAITLIREKFAKEPDVQFSIYNTIRQGMVQSGVAVPPRMRQWGVQMTEHLLGNISAETDTWKSRSLNDPVNPWKVQDDFLTDVMPAFHIMFSEWKGYHPMAVLYSSPFKLPATLSMNVFDNDIDNSPEKKGTSRNTVRIRLRGSNRIVAEYRLHMDRKAVWKDLIKNTRFDLHNWQGQQGYIEVTDSSVTGSVGIGKLEPAVLPLPAVSPGEMAERRVLAVELAGDLKVPTLEPVLRKLLSAPWADINVRIAAAAALMNVSPQQNIPFLGAVFNDPVQPAVLREKVAQSLAQSSSPAVYDMLAKGLSSSTRNGQVNIATLLANTQEGTDHLLAAVKAGNIHPDILSELPVKERLLAHITPAQQKDMDKLTAGNDNARQQLITDRLEAFTHVTVKAEDGRNVFMQNCSMCHQIKGTGGMVGPQLDGIGNWGPKALTEKILDPNRNISEAFRNYNITLKSGKILSGLYRRTEGAVQVFANLSGQEFTVASGDIKEKKASRYTLMPDQFGKTIPEQDFYALLKFLLSTK
ncbi:c-type cytochrome [Chitinophaga sp. SYP-B3965]|uniref:PVC-type heme-binding CxxCH protein n=1 Tax=Chitinophaga sp. SYP-B3965 TaxID=2663120 RepID=UPI001299D432|nr:PVC-type heme-binding CxxCH protein [Chitinophaga sp. SYP-B3965]MRG45279.1 c-type cytochrome [Chitinophaga sp. SYP-B3965]